MFHLRKQYLTKILYVWFSMCVHYAYIIHIQNTKLFWQLDYCGLMQQKQYHAFGNSISFSFNNLLNMFIRRNVHSICEFKTDIVCKFLISKNVSVHCRSTIEM